MSARNALSEEERKWIVEKICKAFPDLASTLQDRFDVELDDRFMEALEDVGSQPVPPDWSKLKREPVTGPQTWVYPL